MGTNISVEFDHVDIDKNTHKRLSKIIIQKILKEQRFQYQNDFMGVYDTTCILRPDGLEYYGHVLYDNMYFPFHVYKIRRLVCC